MHLLFHLMYYSNKNTLSINCNFFYFSQNSQDEDSDWDMTRIPDQPSIGIVVPPVDYTLTEELNAQLQAVVDPASQSQNFGREKYLAALHFVILHS